MNIIMRVVLCFLSVVSFGRLAQAESWDEMVSAYGYRTWWYTVINGGASLGDIEFLQYGRVIGQAVSANIRGDLVVPSRIAGLAVTRVGDYAFYGLVGLTSVRLPDGVTTIGKNAFAGCSELTSVRIPEGVTSIGDSAFEGCTKLESVIIPSSVRSIGDYAFSGCTGLKSVTIVGDEVTIGRWAFGGCSSLADANGFIIVNGILFDYQGVDSEITIPATVTSIGWYAFESQVNLVSVEIPLSVTNIDDCAFCECGGLESVVVPNSVVRIGRAAFRGCCRLTSMILPFIGACRGNSGSEEALFGHVFGWSYSTVGFIYAKQYYDQSQYHFLECHIPSSLKSVVITDESKIGYGAFYGCSGLASVMISSSVTCIEENAFCNCSGLTSITIPESVTSIGRNAFSGCSGFGDGVFATDGWALCVNGNHSSVEIPMGVKRVIPGAFAGHAELMSVTVPPSVVQIGSGCFAGCSGLNGVRISDVAAWCGIDFESTDANPLYYAKKLYLNGKEVIYLDVPRGIEKIGRYAFYNANRFLSVTIPPSVKSVGAGAFAGCGGLSAVNVGDLSAWCGIDFATAEANPLYWAKKLYLNGTEIVDLAVPSGTESIERYAFYNGVDVASVMIPDTVKSIGTDAFKGCTGIKSATVPERFSISDVFPDSRASITTVTIPADATSIADGAFSGCSKITSIAIPSTVTSIGANAFSGCIGLTEIAIPASVTGIGASAFRGCTQITEIKIPEGVGELPDSLCEDCSGLTTVVIPNSVSNISSTAFKDCGNVISVTMPGRFAMKDIFPSSYDKIQDVTILDGEKDLSNAVFAGCSALTTVVISEGVATLGEDLLYGFTNLRELTIPSTVTSIGGYALNGCSVLKTIHVSGNGDVDMLKQMLYESGFDVASVTFDRIVYCKVKFDPQGGIAEWTEAEVREGESVGNLPVVECAGHEFLGWFTAAVGGTQVTEDAVVTENVTYYAHWIQNVTYHIITFDTNGGVCSMSSEQYASGAAVGALPTATREGYEFLGWWTSASGGTQVMAETVVTKDVTFYAHWRCIGSTADEEVIAGEKVTIETGLVGYKATGLPKGLSYNAKTGKITGTTKSVTAGAVEVVFTKAGEEDVKITFEVRAEDVSVGCAALATGSFQSGVMGAADGIPIETFCETGVKSVSVTKLPSGMKYDSKNRLITGAPNKAGNYEVVLTVTTTSGAKETVKIPVSVAAMPVMAVGKFDGFVSVGEDNFGTFTLTTTDAGKLTAKVITAAGTVSFSGTCWDAVDEGVYRATLTTKKGEKLTLALDSTAAWDSNQLSGEFTSAAVAAMKTAAAVPSRTYAVSAQRNAFGKTWYFAATGDDEAGWTFAFTADAKAAALTVTLKADGSTSVAGKLPNGVDGKGKAVTLSVSASGYANVGGLKDGAILADFASVVTVNKVKKVLAITANLWFDRSNDHAEGTGRAKLVK